MQPQMAMLASWNLLVDTLMAGPGFDTLSAALLYS